MGKKWVCLLKSVGKVESNEVFCGAVEEEEGGKKLVESLEEEDESRDSGFVRIEEELKAGEYSASIAYSAPIDVQRADRSPL
ncbi:hypothetical protein L249_7885 [Ophiocordyceps polyrhachis-furcata BCC 54312]|uniref:Uncharacterized protein n=1 Tax=Ophiocordyceps polyrhachis-furcata BCC 54312 TaxID=1330021 RepID=A0A367L0S7_9HYPO|nr:hypothetical protein L249_7885 [Ophiocordyceps polyrhachis-furcata BCC 54312]